MSDKSNTVAEARAWVNVLRESLPQSIDVAALGVRSKAPYQLLCTREAVIWRTEELARTACDALERDDFAAAAILTRAVTENAAMTWSLLEVLETRGKYDPEQLNELLMRLLAGSKIWPELPKPVHVLDLVRKIDKTVTGIMASYDRLSEFVHPNWSGVAGLYSKIDQKNFVTYFGRGLRNADSSRDMIANALLGSLGAFEYAYNRISDLMPVFIGELESLWSDKGEA
ncbi:hypothetical protein ELI24_39080 [Rhizobium ruizarguesonis]|jgi:hypothetical protein|uniref:hypothetical protein n=1 Tax=Rhizobium TaxID=379 RepID=UPI00102F8F27|nr:MULTISPECIES: hypothetical protein [Rhizobium]NKL29136.1 hypothetical protein [Rhizobium leguminosarum bv. viciae]MBY3210074.1 hypothetical protein [Rhizobium laguerreae]MBY5845461.1 hypothetical protein [Rhizobium leguminosarum]NEH85380.1 hypothetical protein [Rhizobium ruizarguesonis]NEI13844.1 hypothetical protein [Rhizobium ruizarguesonis]